MHRRSIKITRIGKAKGRKTTPKGNEPYCAPWELNAEPVLSHAHRRNSDPCEQCGKAGGTSEVNGKYLCSHCLNSGMRVRPTAPEGWVRRGNLLEAKSSDPLTAKQEKSFLRKNGPWLLLVSAGAILIALGFAFPALSFAGFKLLDLGIGASVAGIAHFSFTNWVDGKWVNFLWRSKLLHPNPKGHHGPGRPLEWVFVLAGVGISVALLSTAFGATPAHAWQAGAGMAALGGASLVTYSQFANAWKYVLGKPSIVVSSNGATMSGQESNLGADYGPDTLLGNVGPGPSPTLGIQEAINYVASLAVAAVQVGFSDTYPFDVRLVGMSVFNIGTTINNGAAVTIEGGGSAIMPASPFTALTTINGVTVPAALLTCVPASGKNLGGNDLFRNLVLGTGGTASINTTLFMQNLQKGVLRNVTLSGTYVGLQMTDCYGMNIYSPIIRLLDQYGYQDNNGNANHVYGGWISRCNQSSGYSGVYLNGVQQATFTGTVIQYNSVGVLLAAEVDNVVLRDIWFEDLSTAGNTGVSTNDTTAKSTITLDACYYVGALPSLVDVDYVTALTLTNCFRYNSGTATLTVGSHSTNAIVRGGNLPGVTFSLPAGSLITQVAGYNPQGFATTTPAVPASGSAAKNTNPFKVRLTVLTASGATATITDPSGTVGSSFPITAGQFIELDSNAQITPTYTTLTWQPYGC